MVKIRTRETKKGYHLYLDIYYKGNRKKKYLGEYVSKDYPKLIRENSSTRIKAADREAWDFAKETRRVFQTQLTLSGLSFAKELVSKNDVDFLEFFETQNKIKNNRTYDAALNKLKEFHPKKLPLAIVDLDFIHGFHHHLINSNLSPKSIYEYLRRFKTIWRLAMDFELTMNDPFKRFKLPKVAPKKPIFLDKEEIELIAKYEGCRTKKQEQIRLAFLFCCFVGIRFGDVVKLRREDIDKDNFMSIITEKRNKPLRLHLPPTAVKILNTVPTKKGQIFNFSNSYANNVMKEIIKKLGIEKDITFHKSRDTAATTLRKQGVREEDIRDTLGHASSRTTQIYSHIDDIQRKKIMEQLEDIDFFVKSY